MDKNTGHVCSPNMCGVRFLLQTAIPFSAKSGMDRRGSLPDSCPNSKRDGGLLRFLQAHETHGSVKKSVTLAHIHHVGIFTRRNLSHNTDKITSKSSAYVNCGIHRKELKITPFYAINSRCYCLIIHEIAITAL